MKNWYEALPGFWLPLSKQWEPGRWPDYTTRQVEDQLERLPEAESLLRLRGLTRPSKQQWGAWYGAFKEDRPIRWVEDFYGPVADAIYDTARYKYLVPAWRRAIVKVLTELDDIEDQLSTILWVLEWITRKWVPLPQTIMNGAQRINKTLDCAERVLAGINIVRGAKQDYAECLRRAQRQKEKLRRQKAGLLAWFRDNWGRLLEAAQATGTWFDVGIVLGPIMGWIEEGIWGVAKKTVDNYLIAADALMPGYREAFWEQARKLSEKVDQAWDQTWEGLRRWDTETIMEDFPGFFAP